MKGPAARGAARLAGVLAVALMLWGEGASARALRAAVFDFELFDTSLEGEVRGALPAETARLAMISEQLRDLLAKSLGYQIVDIAPLRDRIEAAGHLYGCNGCEAGIARDLGADVAVRGEVQKVSNLILNINIYISDTITGDVTKVVSADIRGNTDESWSRGLSWLVRHRLAED